MTNNEKFEEVFGVKLDINVDLCVIADCESIPCSQCPLYGNNQEFSEYHAPHKEESNNADSD